MTISSQHWQPNTNSSTFFSTQDLSILVVLGTLSVSSHNSYLGRITKATVKPVSERPTVKATETQQSPAVFDTSGENKQEVRELGNPSGREFQELMRKVEGDWRVLMPSLLDLCIACEWFLDLLG